MSFTTQEEKRYICICWEIDDVLEVRPDLTADQAWEVLKQAKEYWHLGISVERLEELADNLYPQ